MRLKFPQFSHQALFWALAAVGTAADLWSKAAVFRWLADKPHNEVSIIGNFITFILRENAGAAFSMAHGQRVFLVTVSTAAFIGLITAFQCGLFKTRLAIITAGMFLAGIAGNLYDRLFNEGRVRDFIDVNLYVNNYHWPTFNIADSLMCIALGLFFIDAYRDVFKSSKKVKE